jgi:hypothetical protein
MVKEMSKGGDKRKHLIHFHIGSSNTLHYVEKDKVYAVLNEYFKGYTVIDATGYYEGSPEASIIVEVVAVEIREELLRIAEELRSRLDQWSVLMDYTLTVMLEADKPREGG